MMNQHRTLACIAWFAFLVFLGLAKSAIASLDSAGILQASDSENTNLFSAVIDPDGDFAYFAYSAITIGSVTGRVVKIDLADFTESATLTLGSGDNEPRAAIIDPAGDFAYFATVTSPGRVVKVDLGDFSRETSLSLGTGNNWIYSAVIDPVGAFAYFGTATTPGRVIKVNLDTFEVDDTLVLPSGENRLVSAVIDHAGDFAYFGTDDSPGKVVKIDLATFTRVGSIELAQDENDLVSAVIDSDANYAYFGTRTAPGRLVKIDLGSFTRDAAVTFGTQNRSTTAVIDPHDNFVYVGTANSRLVKIDLASFELVDTRAYFDSEYGAAVIDGSGDFAYFGGGAFSFPKVVRKISLADMKIEKSVSAVNGQTEPPFNYSAEGDVITYEIVVSNTGSAGLTGIAVSDPAVAGLDCTWPADEGELFSLETVECQGDYTITLADMNNGSFENTASANSQQTAEAEDSATIAALVEAEISLTKSINSGDPYSEVGETISYLLEAVNIGNVSLTSVTIDDAGSDLSNCLPGLGATLEPGQSMSCDGTYIVTQADLDAGSYTNSASAQGLDPDDNVIDDTDSVKATATQNGELALTKIVLSGNNFSEPGQTITYFLGLTNAGNVTLSNVMITDPDADGFNCSPGLPATLSPGASLNCSDGIFTVTQAEIDAGGFTNTAIATAIDPSEQPVETSASATATAQQSPAITLEKIIVDGEVYAGVGDVITYSLTAVNAGNVSLSGVEIIDLGASIDSCDPASPAFLAPMTSIACTATYTVTGADVEEGSYVNTATVNAMPPDDGLIQATDSTTALFEVILQDRFEVDLNQAASE